MQVIEKIKETTSKDLALSMDLIHDVINFQFKSVKKATSQHNIIEISNLCTLKVRPKNVIKELKRYTEILDSYNKKLPIIEEEKKENLLKRIEYCKKEVIFLNKKLENANI